MQENVTLMTTLAQLADKEGVGEAREPLFTTMFVTFDSETLAPSEEAQPTFGPWTGFKPVRLETLGSQSTHGSTVPWRDP
ncbi:hypothetical protein E2C01_063683 [Portunus trituberculatus]|uniref:Uncharacterized protein n=1 Tax=Portunus trituberculatus TaxID=210409 RepID=A0A5B7HL57_PORTR|nr:hypothetical protein [Portunus trituberculatus]